MKTHKTMICTLFHVNEDRTEYKKDFVLIIVNAFYLSVKRETD